MALVPGLTPLLQGLSETKTAPNLVEKASVFNPIYQ
jgi:hypothetical protein